DVPAFAARQYVKRETRLSGEPAIRSPARPAALRGEIKEEAAVAGGCRGTFAPKGCRSRRAGQMAAERAIKQIALASPAMPQKKRPGGRGGRRGLGGTGPGRCLPSRGFLQGRERSVTDVASVTGYMTTRRMDSS